MDSFVITSHRLGKNWQLLPVPIGKRRQSRIGVHILA
jgi:hypothetical protein